MALLTNWDDSSLVIDKLCDDAVEEDTAVACFYYDFAARNQQSPANMLGSLLRQLVSGLDGIPEVVVRGFRNQKKVIGGRGLQVSGILKMFQTITTIKRTFILGLKISYGTLVCNATTSQNQSNHLIISCELEPRSLQIGRAHV